MLTSLARTFKSSAQDSVEADPHMAAVTKEVLQLTGELNSPFRKGENTLVMQHFDMLIAAPVVEQVAAMIGGHREEMAALELLAQELNVLDPDFLTWRLTTPQGRGIGVDGNFAIPRPSAVSEEALQLYLIEQRIEEAWGQALLAVMRQMPEELEHHEEMVNDFERLFDRCSDFLRALLPETTDAVQLLNVTVMDPSETTTQYVVSAALLKHPPADSVALVRFVEHLKSRGIPLTIAATEQLERIYLRFMKGQDAAKVFNSVTAAGVVPLSTRPFAMLFNNLTDSNAVLDAYDLMLDYGIAPEASTLRIMCKQSRLEYAKLHFTTVFKNMASTETPSHSSTPPPPRSQPRTPLAEGSNGTATSSNAVGASRRRDERSYFAQRIVEMAERHPKTPLLEVLKVLHRAEVEGTSLRGDTYIMSALLRYYCRGTTPRRHLVLPFSASLAYRPGPVSEEASADTDGTAPGGREFLKPPTVSNAFDFELDSNTEDLLEGEGEGEGILLEELESQREAPSRSRGGEAEAERPRRPRVPPRDPFLADCSEEGTYILEVLKTYGSYPDNTVLHALSEQYDGKAPHMEIVAAAVDALFEGCHASRGAASPIDCRFLHALGYYYIDNRWRERAHQLLRQVLEVFYAYQVDYHADLCGAEKWFSYFAVIVGVKTGPLDLGVGLFAASLALGDTNVNQKVATKLMPKRDSSEHVLSVVAELERCEWDYHRILCCDALMLEPQDRASTEDEERTTGAAVGGRDKGGRGGGSASRAADEEPGKGSIYTTATQGPSSFNNAHLVSARPSLVTYMYVALRDLNVEKKAIDWLRNRLRLARQEAVATRDAR